MKEKVSVNEDNEDKEDIYRMNFEVKIVSFNVASIRISLPKSCSSSVKNLGRNSLTFWKSGSEGGFSYIF